MDEARFTRLIDELESYAHGHPAAYRLRVGLLAVLGSAYLLTVVVNELTSVVELSDFTVFAALEDQHKYLEGIFSQIPGAAVFSSEYLSAEDSEHVRH